MCVHAAEFLKLGAACENSAESYFQRLRFAYNKNFDCPVMSAVVELQVKILGRFLTEVVLQRGSGDSLSFSFGDIMLGNRRQKRRRVDEDLQAALLHTAIQAKRAKTVGGLARSTGVLDPSTVETWVPKHMGAYRSALAMEFQSSSAVSVCFDAARFGQPQEDIVSFVLSNLDIGGGAGHLAPQVEVVRLGAWAQGSNTRIGRLPNSLFVVFSQAGMSIEHKQGRGAGERQAVSAQTDKRSSRISMGCRAVVSSSGWDVPGLAVQHATRLPIRIRFGEGVHV